jgi:hypothetical protein
MSNLSTIDYPIKTQNRKTYFNSYLTNSSIFNANGNYAVATDFSYTNTSSTNTLFLTSLIITIEDDGLFPSDEYGGIGNALSNGIQLFFTDTGGTNNNFIIGSDDPIKQNSDWFSYTPIVRFVKLDSGNTTLILNIKFEDISPVILRQNDFIAIRLNDNFTNLVEHKFQIKGFNYPTINL